MLLPAPEGPTTTRHSPASSRKATSRSRARPSAVRTVAPSTASWPTGPAAASAGPAGRRQQLAQPGPALARHAHRLPGRHHLLDRGQRLADQDRGRQHAAGGQLVLQHQPGAQAHDPALDEKADEAGAAADPAAALGRLLGAGERRAAHPHRRAVSVSSMPRPGPPRPCAQRLGQPGRLVLHLPRLAQARLVTRSLSTARSASSTALPPTRAASRVQDPDDRQRHRQPGRIEQRGDHRPGQRLAQAGQIAHRLGRHALGVGRLDRGREEPGLEAGGDPRQEAGPHPVEHAQTHSAMSPARLSSTSVSTWPEPSTRS